MTIIKLDTYRNIKWLAQQRESPERVAEVIEELMNGLEDKDGVRNTFQYQWYISRYPNMWKNGEEDYTVS